MLYISTSLSLLHGRNEGSQVKQGKHSEEGHIKTHDQTPPLITDFILTDSWTINAGRIVGRIEWGK